MKDRQVRTADGTPVTQPFNHRHTESLKQRRNDHSRRAPIGGGNLGRRDKSQMQDVTREQMWLQKSL